MTTFYKSVPQLLLLSGSLLISSCETVIDADLDEGPAQLSVDGWLTDQPGPQTIRLTQTAGYLNNQPVPPTTGATVTVTDNTGKTYNFTDPDNDGNYVWTPTATDTLGKVGRTYQLTINYQGEEYRSLSRMNRVPEVDSIIFRKEKVNPLPSAEEGYQAEFYARDFPGGADYYRVRFYRNGQLQNRPENLIVLYDASFNSSGDTDGLQFIRPIRQSINPENFYDLGDSVKVAIESITPEAFYFFIELSDQVTNGGLFAAPPANVPTNIINVNPNGRKATGFFVASATRNRTVAVAQENIRSE